MLQATSRGTTVMMKHRWRAVATGFLLGLAVIHPSLAVDQSAVDQIRQLEVEVNAAYAANDLPKYFSYYADDFRGLFPEGATTLAEYKKSWGDFIKSGGASRIPIFRYNWRLPAMLQLPVIGPPSARKIRARIQSMRAILRPTFSSSGPDTGSWSRFITHWRATRTKNSDRSTGES